MVLGTERGMAVRDAVVMDLTEEALALAKS
jgi:hypothetical protein